MRKFLAILTLSASFAASANALRQMPLEELSRKSDLVVVGNVRIKSDEIAEVHVREVLKGEKSLLTLQLLRHSLTGIAEDDPNCCRDNGNYLLFLQRTPRGVMVSTNGPFGVVELP